MKMRIVFVVAVMLALASACFADSFLQARNTVDGGLNSGYSESGTGWQDGGTGGVCTATPAPPEGWSSFGSRRKPATYIDGYCSFVVSGLTAGTHNVYFAYAPTTRTDAANTTYKVWDNLTSEASPLASGSLVINNSTNGNVWLLLTPTAVSTGNTVTVRLYQGSPQGDYMTVTGVRVAPTAAVADWSVY